MTILDRIEGTRSEAITELPGLPQRYVGCEYLGENIGGCIRAAWYKHHLTDETNPQADRLTVAHQLHEKLRDLILARIFRASPDAKTVAFLFGPIRFRFDAVYKNDSNQLVGVQIFSGAGYGFRSEVFGTKFKEGRPKEDHLMQVWAAMAATQLPIHYVEMIYIDRGQLDEICHVSGTSPLTEQDINDFIQKKLRPTPVPPCSYEKQWTDAEFVAKIYAEKQISKKKYETWKDTGIGGDWHCEYCPFLKRCEEDGET